MRNPFKATIRQLTADVSDYQRRIVETEKLISALRSRSDGEPATVEAPKRRKRRRHLMKARARRAAKRPARARRAVPATGDAQPVVATTEAASAPKPFRAVKGSSQFAGELREIDEILAGLAEADRALNKATRAKDAGAIAAAGEQIQRLRAQGGELLIKLAGRARLPGKLDIIERRRWRAAVAAAAPKPARKRAVTPPPRPPKRIDSGWVLDENGNRSRSIEAVEDRAS
jgi:hypothetical protein